MACGTRSTPSSRASSSLERTSVEEAVSLELTPDEAARITREQRERNAAKSKNLLEVKNLSTHFFTADGVVRAVDDVTFELGYGETLGLVGESGCGKSVTALSLTRLVPNPPGKIVSGSVVFDGVDLLKLSDDGMRKLRGKEIGFIFQDPLTSLNPTLTIGYQIAEAIRQHMGLSKKASYDRVVELLSKVGIPRPRDRLNDYPHQFSGGMRQRVMIAIALACDPQLLIADEPTTALDVTIQAQILELIDRLRRDLGMGVILVTHDLGVIAGRADRVAVMYAGRVVEQADADRLFATPRHRYTEALLRALPERAASTRERLHTIPGLPPDLTQDQTGCRFAPRCQFAQEDCRQLDPPLLPLVSVPGGQ